jgi:alpha-L-rhamnosidase
MKIKKRFTLFLVMAVPFLFIAWGCGQNNLPSVRVSSLTCEYLTDPLGIDDTAPRLSWKLNSTERGQIQTAYRVIVSSSVEKLAANEGDIWDSGKVVSDRSVHVDYGGRPLKSRDRCFWKVRVWDREGMQSEWSDAARWEMGLLDESEWDARWIRTTAEKNSAPPAEPAPMFRKPFEVSGPVKSARAYVTGLGYFVMYLNGEKVSDHMLDPVKTRYDRRVSYVTFDITDRLNRGGNAVGMVLGTGWFNMHTKAVWGFGAAPWRERPAMLCRIEIDYEDGSRGVIASDSTWKTSTGPTVFDGIRNGETYDARLEKPGWRTFDYDDSEWTAAVEIASPAETLSAQMMQPMRVTKEIAPVSVTEVKPGVHVFDLGQNIAGIVELHVTAPRGTKITMKQGERLYPDGTVEQKQIARFIRSGELQTDTYICKGGGPEKWSPRFVYHGFQYIEVAGLPENPGTPPLDTLTGKVIHTDFASTGNFECSNELFNKIQSCTRWSFTGNYHSIPTDCPHREKIGWTGDAHIVAETGLFNYDMGASYTKWIRDFADEQRADGDLPGVVPTSGWGYTLGRNEYRKFGYGPHWEGAFLFIPWDMCRYLGDTRILSENYDRFKKYVDFLTANAEDGMINFGIDDHAPAITHTDPRDFATGLYYKAALIVAETAAILGNSGDTSHYSALANTIRSSYNRNLFDPATGLYGSGSQTALACPLYFNIVEPEHKARVLENLIAAIENQDGHLDTGVVGVKFLMNALVDCGRADVAYGIATQTTFPSWGYWIERGANTLWQKWDDSMSRNHIMFGDISAWMFKNVGGINPDDDAPGFKRTIIRPIMFEGILNARIDWAKTVHETPYGPVACSWTRENGPLSMEVTVPVNATAQVHIPGARIENVRDGGVPAADAEGVISAEQSGDDAVFEIGSGTYTFRVEE